MVGHRTFIHYLGKEYRTRGLRCMMWLQRCKPLYAKRMWIYSVDCWIKRRAAVRRRG